MGTREPKKTRAEAQIAVAESSGNVFADLGFEHPEEMLAKRNSCSGSVTSSPIES